MSEPAHIIEHGRIVCRERGLVTAFLRDTAASHRSIAESFSRSGLGGPSEQEIAIATVIEALADGIGRGEHEKEQR